MEKFLTFLLDFGSALLFLFLFLATGNIYLATGVGMAAALATLVWIWIRDRRIRAMQALGPAIVLVMGGATILFHDPRFVMLKPTLILGFIGAVMLKPGWLIPYLPPVASVAPRPLIVTIGYVYAATHLMLAAANVVVHGTGSKTGTGPGKGDVATATAFHGFAAASAGQGSSTNRDDTATAVADDGVAIAIAG